MSATLHDHYEYDEASCQTQVPMIEASLWLILEPKRIGRQTALLNYCIQQRQDHFHYAIHLRGQSRLIKPFTRAAL